MTAYVKAVILPAAGSAILIALVAGPALAQTPATAAPQSSSVQTAFLGDAFMRVVHGREVWITTSNGMRFKARVAELTSTGLTVTATTGQGRAIRFEDITRMEKVTHRMRNHITAGAIIGGGLGAIAFGFCDGDADCALPVLLTYTGIGVGIGALNGYIRNNVNRDDDLIYEARPRTTTTVAVSPILSRTRKGVAFTLTWR